MVARKFLSVSSFKTASRCWVPMTKAPAYRSFSSRQRCVNFNTLEHDATVNMISNDDVLQTEDIKNPSETPFEPTVFSSEEVFTAGPVNKA
ncbi:CIC11C00000004845 [Sungouiella intermedia]|uniref:CIC11C00000004845 n=1 Tax=Sungouiella intermedia TaxID=45354 RepID=A0A1L0BZ08_9ASCO|nr:CIC11C00000004845 [[Candida] intermedia]